MINDFVIQANPKNNELNVRLDGYFMKSEIYLAFQLAQNEAKKLNKGFVVLMDIKNLNMQHRKKLISYERLVNLMRHLGAGSLKIKGFKRLTSDGICPTVGFYPYENAWFLS